MIFFAFAPRTRKIHRPWDFRRSQYPWLIYSFLSLPVDGLRWTDNECRTVKTLDHQTVCRRKLISVEEGAPGTHGLAASTVSRTARKETWFFPVIMFNYDFTPFPCHLLYVASGEVFTRARFIVFLVKGRSELRPVWYRIMRWLKKHRYPVSLRDDVTGTLFNRL